MKKNKLFFTSLATIIAGVGLWLGMSHDVSAQGATTGTIKGTVKFEGTAPKAKPVNMGADPVCSGAHTGKVMSEDVVVGAAGELANVIAYIPDVVGEFKAPETAAVLDQNGCIYKPHVLGVVNGQKLEIKNSDKTLHNVHCYEGSSTCFNRAMFQGMAPIKHEFKKHGNIVKFKCDVHPWMTAYALVAKNPFFGTSGKDGAFTIKNVPVGKHTVKVWHEKFGEQTVEVDVKAGAEAAAAVTFKAAS